MKKTLIILLVALSAFYGLYLIFENGFRATVSKYVLISHTRLCDNSGIDSIVSKANLSKYDVLMLGGDMANLSSLDTNVLNRLDNVFEMSNSNTLWGLGNHDYSNVGLLNTYTKRKTFYAYKHKETQFIVLDTQLDSSRITGEQLVFFDSVMTSTDAHNVIILTHKLIWMKNNNDLERLIDSVSNGYNGDCSYCVQNNNFYQDIYPKLLEFKGDSKNVYCIAGDIGFNVKQFEYITKEGVVFLASGINANKKDNYFLEFTHKGAQGVIDYEFKPIEEL